MLKYHLTPRTKGFTASINHMRGKAVAIYDIQMAFKPSDPVKPTMKNLLLGKPLEGHMYCKRIPIDEVPEGDEAAAEWLHKLYQQKVIYSNVCVGQSESACRFDKTTRVISCNWCTIWKTVISTWRNKLRIESRRFLQQSFAFEKYMSCTVDQYFVVQNRADLFFRLHIQCFPSRCFIALGASSHSPGRYM